MSGGLGGFLMNWRIVILAIFVVAMLLTPAVLPLTALYVGGILLCRRVAGRRSQLN